MEGREIKREKRSRWCLTPVLLVIVLASAALLTGAISAVPGAEVFGVSRHAPTGLAPDSEFDVTLIINSEYPLVIGISETIPEGFSFVHTLHPADQYDVSGQIVTFAVINETEIQYRVKAPAHGEGTFTGRWIDMLTPKEGNIADTIVRVGDGALDEGPLPTPKATTPQPTPTPGVPGFEALFTAVSLIIAFLFILVLRINGGVE